MYGVSGLRRIAEDRLAGHLPMRRRWRRYSGRILRLLPSPEPCPGGHWPRNVAVRSRVDRKAPVSPQPNPSMIRCPGSPGGETGLPAGRNATVVKLLNWTVVGRLGHELATINCPRVVSGAADCDRAMGAHVGRRANFGRVLIDGGASPARGCGQAGARRWAASGRDPGTRKAALSSQVPNNAVTLIAL
jgi:hypothetical protein